MIHNHEVPGSIPGPATKKGGRKASFFRRRDHGIEPEKGVASHFFFLPFFNSLREWAASGRSRSHTRFAPIRLHLRLHLRLYLRLRLRTSISFNFQFSILCFQFIDVILRRFC